MAVALSFAFVILRDVRAPDDRSGPPGRFPVWRPRLRAIGLLGWVWIVAQTIVGGSRTPTCRGSSCGSMAGSASPSCRPSSVRSGPGSIRSRRCSTSAPRSCVGWASRRGSRPGIRPGSAPGQPCWPRFFVWLELVYRGGGLGVVLIVYTILTLLAMAHFGRDTWRSRARRSRSGSGRSTGLAPDGPPRRGRSPPPAAFAAGLVGPRLDTGPRRPRRRRRRIDPVRRPVADAALVRPVRPAGRCRSRRFELVVFLGLVVGLALAVGTARRAGCHRGRARPDRRRLSGRPLPDVPARRRPADRRRDLGSSPARLGPVRDGLLRARDGLDPARLSSGPCSSPRSSAATSWARGSATSSRVRDAGRGATSGCDSSRSRS